MGAGDGKATLAAAWRDVSTLAIALDASADALADGARRALRRRTPNTLFLVSSVESLPPSFASIADEVTINFPWGSLLRGLALGDVSVTAPLARMAKPGAGIRALLSVEPRDAAAGLAPLDAATLRERASIFARVGLDLVSCAVATDETIAASGSSWAKRLAAGKSRAVLAVTLRRSSVMG